MLNFVLCEDNYYVINIIKNIINKTVISYDFDYKITSFSKYNTDMKNLINDNSDIKIYILDLELPNKNGIDIANEIRNNDWDSVIIIFTSHDELEMNLLKHKLLILDFISKFDDYEKRLSDTISIIIKKLNNKKMLSFKVGRQLHRLKFNDILYILKDSKSNITVVVTKEDKYNVRESLISIVNKLDNNFIKTHKSCYINKNNVESVDFKTGIIYFKNGSSIDYLSRNYKKELRKRL